MTAFACERARCEHGEVICEIRSVNHRFLDVTVRLPEGMGTLEHTLRQRLIEALDRGKVDCQVTVRRSDAQGHLAVDLALATELVRSAEAVQAAHPGLAPLALADILRWPGVVQAPATPFWEGAIMTAAQDALASFLSHREREGGRLATGLDERLEQILVRLETLKPLVLAAQDRLRERLRARVKALDVSLDPARLEQEVVLQAQRSDVAEECDRLAVHVAEVRSALGSGGPVGRRLDFLMQEMNREANTLASKSPTVEITSEAVAIKVVIEQMREQVQNIE